jgi:hypothetical protein
VTREGNRLALQALLEVFEPRDYFGWRGLGSIAHSGMRLRSKYASFDAELKFSVPGLRIADPKACQCGEILKGVKGMQSLWHCLHSRNAHRFLHGVLGGCLRCLLQFWATVENRRGCDVELVVM